jgi:ADP-heptose:LPS heptosyltransferase/2-polyprenyl-3-methyl-5-hydroxy-6-metoxy-1,4-benzoquinol methylase
MEHNLFKPRDLEEGKHAVVGDCNGFTMQQRWDVETPLFAKEILKYAPENAVILDYGCGVGRLAKEVLSQRSDVSVVGVDASVDMVEQSKKYVNNERFTSVLPYDLRNLKTKFDVCYCIYVLQHCPSIDLRTSIERIHFFLKDEGTFAYCSSDYRMAIRFDGQGFHDDRYLGVDIREEISKVFLRQHEMFDQEILNANPILKVMIKDGLQHPAYIYKKRIPQEGVQLFDLFSAPVPEIEAQKKERAESSPNAPVDVAPISDGAIQYGGKTLTKKVILCNRLAPGDILVMTNALRDLHKAYPDVMIDVRTPCPEIFENNPHIRKFDYDNDRFEKINTWFQNNGSADNNDTRVGYFEDVTVVDMHYPAIHTSGTNGNHFCEGHGKFLEFLFGIKLNQTEIRPEIFMTEQEKLWMSPALIKGGHKGKYWVINAGSKGDYTLKQYHKYQEVVDMFKDEITFVQIGQIGHNHEPLQGCIDLRGKTSVRELFRLIHKSEGVLTCVSFPMHIAAALSKPCVVVAGAREGTRWELYPNHQFIYLNGTLPCAPYDGCWRSQHKDCINMTEGGIPKCMAIITPKMVADRIKIYYEGGVLTK